MYRIERKLSQSSTGRSCSVQPLLRNQKFRVLRCLGVLRRRQSVTRAGEWTATGECFRRCDLDEDDDDRQLCGGGGRPAHASL